MYLHHIDDTEDGSSNPEQELIREAGRLLKRIRPDRDPAFVELWVDSVLMGLFRLEPNHFDALGLQYSLQRFWSGSVTLDRIEGRNHYYISRK